MRDIEKRYEFTEKGGIKSLRHKPGLRISILPYNTNFATKHIDAVNDFTSIIGGFSRFISGKKLNPKFNDHDLIENVTSRVDMQDGTRTAFKRIIKELFYNESGEIQIFHPIILNYISESSNNDLSKKVSEFLNNVLYNSVGEELGEDIKSTYDFKPDNILLKLLIESMPVLTNAENEDLQYTNLLPFVSEIFVKDLKFMLKNPKFYVEGFEMLLKYYYFFYVSQLSMKLNQMFDADLSKPAELFFNLDFESTSKTRISYGKGWRLLSNNVGILYSHVNCLELLNHCNVDKPCSYIDLNKLVDNMNVEEKSNLEQDIGILIMNYKDHIQDVSWGSLKINNMYENKVLQKMYELFMTIDFQFAKSNRNKPYKSYARWFEEFCKANFLRKRGSLGYTLSITEDYLLFLTKLCINGKEKVRLKNLFEEYEKRGVFFDMDSKNKIIQLFEKLNLLVKKSDSGDAQYVKSIL